ncbi:MAG TPA: c-type cytochrome, partial [Rubricoccaceae bacterium]
ASVARGAHLAAINGCRDCHGADLGGQVFVDAPPFRATASNLTRGEGGVGGRYTDADWDRAVRHGVKPDGRAVLVMPSAGFHNLADADAADLIAYIKSLDPVDRALPPSEVRPLGRVLAAGPLDVSFEVNEAPARASAPPAGPTAAYGAYLASITCAYCHGSDLRGAQPPNPDSPPAPDLAAAGAWTYPQFVRALRTGVRPAGATLDPHIMPWTLTAAMTDDELAALYAYFGTFQGAARSQPDA